jgi:hypothetical protein
MNIKIPYVIVKKNKDGYFFKQYSQESDPKERQPEAVSVDNKILDFLALHKVPLEVEYIGSENIYLKASLYLYDKDIVDRSSIKQVSEGSIQIENRQFKKDLLEDIQ